MTAKRVYRVAAAVLIGLSASAHAQTTASAVTELSLRSGPSAEFETIAAIPAGAQLTLEGCLEGGPWCQVNFAGIQGWVQSDTILADFGGEPAVVAEQRTEVDVPVVTYEEKDGGTALGAVTGAAAGALLAGPVGAAVGAVGGAIMGDAADVPDPVISYVRTNVTEPVVLDGDIAVGATLPETVALTPVPQSDFQYVYVNETPVIVEPTNRQIVHIVR